MNNFCFKMQSTDQSIFLCYSLSCHPLEEHIQSTLNVFSSTTRVTRVSSDNVNITAGHQEPAEVLYQLGDTSISQFTGSKSTVSVAASGVPVVASGGLVAASGVLVVASGVIYDSSLF